MAPLSQPPLWQYNLMSDWKIGLIRLDSQRRALCLAEQQVYLEPKVFALLEALLAADQQLLSRSQLVELVWQGRVVSDSAINRATSLLRKAFASLDDSQPYLETYAKVGYRLVVPAHQQSPEAKTAADSVLLSDTKAELATAAQVLTEVEMARTSAQYSPFFRDKLLFLFAILLIFILLGWFFYSDQANTSQNPLIHAIAQPLTSDKGAELQLSASADGRFLLYLQQRHQSQSGWWLQQGHQRQALRLATAYNQAGLKHVLLSPQADALLYQYCHNGSCQLYLHQLQQDLTLNPNSDLALLPYPPDSVLQWQWQADGLGFYFLQRDDKTKPYHSFHYRIATKALRQLTLNASAPGDLALAVSPDGNQLVVASYQQQQQTLLTLLSLASLEKIAQQTAPYAVSSMVWHQQQLWFGCASQLCFWSFANNKVSAVFTATAPIQSMVSLPGHLAFAVLNQRSSIWRQPLAGTTAEAALVQSSRQESMPRPAGQDLVFLSNRSGQTQLWLKDKTQHEKLLATLPEPAGFVALAVSASGDEIAFSHQGALYLLNKNNSKLTQVLGPETKAGPVRFAPDGASLLFGSEKSGDWQLWSYQRNNKKLSQLTTQGGYSGYWWQGKLLYSKYHQDGLFVKTPDSDNEQLLLEDFDKINWLNWQLDGDNLYFFKPQQGVFQLDLSLATQQQKLQPQPLTAQQAKLIFAAPPGFVHHYQLANNVIWYVKREAAEGDIYQLAVP